MQSSPLEKLNQIYICQTIIKLAGEAPEVNLEDLVMFTANQPIAGFISERNKVWDLKMLLLPYNKS